MLAKIKAVRSAYASLGGLCYVKVSSVFHANLNLIAIMGGILLLNAGLAEYSMAQADPNQQIIFGMCNVFALTEGAFGALVMTVSGLIAVVSAAMGAYRAAMSLIIVALGTYLVRPVVILFFGDWDCTQGARVIPGG